MVNCILSLDFFFFTLLFDEFIYNNVTTFLLCVCVCVLFFFVLNQKLNTRESTSESDLFLAAFLLRWCSFLGRITSTTPGAPMSCGPSPSKATPVICLVSICAASSLATETNRLSASVEKWITSFWGSFSYSSSQSRPSDQQQIGEQSEPPINTMLVPVQSTLSLFVLLKRLNRTLLDFYKPCLSIGSFCGCFCIDLACLKWWKLRKHEYLFMETLPFVAVFAPLGLGTSGLLVKLTSVSLLYRAFDNDVGRIQVLSTNSKAILRLLDICWTKPV